MTPQAPGLEFTLPTDESSDSYKEVQPWLELIELKTFSESTLSVLPLSYQTTDGWYDLIVASAGLNGHVETPPSGIISKPKIRFYSP